MADRPSIFIGRGSSDFELLLGLANRHGLITGATGTGKTVTLRVLAEGFSASGVPVFMADVKGDLAGICKPGGDNPKVAERVQKLGIQGYAPEGMPTCFWDLLGEQGHPVRAAVSEMGPVLLARLLELNDTQAGVLNLAFKFADDNGLLLLDLKDLRALLTHIADNAKELTVKYGNVAATTIGAIQRSLLMLETQGGDKFFSEPALDLNDLMRKDGRGRGIVSVLAADKLMMRPRLYATFLLWLLSELYEGLPEIGDPDQPKLVFFFDEAHLLFNDSPKALIDRVEQVVRLIRSKGVGVYFVTQNPLDVPETVLGQLGNRVQHALRAFTPKDQKAVRAAAETFRANPKLDTAAAILELGVGEALVSLLDAKGTPSMVDRGLIAPPRSRLGPIDPADRQAVMKLSPITGKYDQVVDRDSAYEHLTQRLTEGPAPQTADAAGAAPSGGGWMSRIGLPWGTGDAPPAAPAPSGRQAQRPAAPARGRETVMEAVVKSVARNVAGQVGRQIGAQIVRGVLGSILKR